MKADRSGAELLEQADDTRGPFWPREAPAWVSGLFYFSCFLTSCLRWVNDGLNLHK